MNGNQAAADVGLVTYEEAAEYLHVGIKAVRAAVAADRLHPVKLGGIARKFLYRTEVERYDRERNERRRAGLPAPVEPPASAARADSDAARNADTIGAITAHVAPHFVQIAAHMSRALEAAYRASSGGGEGATLPKRMAS